MQPPPCGCVLKHAEQSANEKVAEAAASVRLCVETFYTFANNFKNNAAASVRLCVETSSSLSEKTELLQPPPCGCVLKPQMRYGLLLR